MLQIYCDGPYGVTTTITDQIEVVVNNVAPALTVAANQAVVLGNALTLTNLGTFSDPGFGTGEAFTYEIDWGDGSPVITGTPRIDTEGHAGPNGEPPAVATRGSFDGTHTYTQTGHYVVSVTVADDDGGSAVRTFRVDVADSQYASVNEGASYTLALDPGAILATAWAIDWGDGGPIQVISGNPTSVGHVYADGPSSHRIDAWVSDGTETYYSQAVFLDVFNVAPTLTTAGNQAVNEGAMLSLSDLGTLTDPGFGLTETFTYTINWGDGAANSTGSATVDVAGSAGVLTRGSFDGSHTYADNGTYMVTVMVTDDDGGVGSDSLVVTVNNVVPVVVAGADQSVNEGAVLSWSGSFSDPGADTWTATVDYGDGSGSQALTLNPDKTFTLSHTYADNGTYTVTVTVSDSDLDVGADTVLVTVNNVVPVVAAGADQSVNEGAVLSWSGSFVDPGADTWTAMVNYGDGSGSQALTLNPDKTFALSHIYADDGSYTVTVTVTDDDGGVGSDTVAVAVNNVVPTIAVTGDASVSEGSAYTVNLGAITDPGADTVTQWVVHWGDGTTDTYTSGGAKTHVYADDNPTGTAADPYQIVVDLVDEDGTHAGAGSLGITVNNVAPTVTIDGEPASVAEGTEVNLSAGVSDPGAAETFTYAWTVTKDGNAFASGNAAAFSFTPDDGPAQYVVSLTVTDDDTGVGTALAVTISGTNVAPTVVAGADQSVNEGAVLSWSGSFVDPGPDTWTATVDYGDGSGSQALTLNPDKTFALSHTYADNGAYTVTVTVTDSDLDVGTDTVLVTVNNVVPVVVAGADQSVNEGAVLSWSGSFVDPGADTWTVTVDYGDGSGSQALTLNPDKTFALSHTYADDGSYTVTVTVTDDDGGVGSDTVAVAVNNVAPALTVVGNQTVSEGALLSLSNIGTFTDPGFDNALNPAPGETTETFTYSIDWGDGTGNSAGNATVDAPGSAGVPTQGSFDGSHTYADSGTYTVTLTAIDDDGGSGTRTFLVTVNNVVPTLTVVGNQVVDEGTLLSLTDLGTFTDPGFGPSETFTYSVNWGDGAANSTGSATVDVAGSAGVLTQGSFDGSHTYADNGVYTVTVVVNDDDGGSDTKTFQVTVSNVAPTLAAQQDRTVDEGAALDVLVGISDPGFRNLAISTDETFSYTIHWGDGTADQAGQATIDSFGGPGTPTLASANLSHVYADNGTYTVTVTASDDDGGSDTKTFQVTVNNVAPTLAVSGNQTMVEDSTLTLPAIGTFTDPGFHNPLNPNGASVETFGYTISWGDGSLPDQGTATIDTPGGRGILTAGVFDAAHDFRAPGTYTVTIRVTDDDGGFDQETFTVTVTSRSNTAPVFDFDPVIRAYVNKPFTDLASAYDNDGDADLPLVFTGTIDLKGLVNPEDDNFEVAPNGHITWMPSAALVGQTFDVVLSVEDQRGAVAMKPYQISVYPKPNASPQIKSRPPETFIIATPTAGDPDPRVSPNSLQLKLNLGDAATQTFLVTIPDAQRPDFFADVVVLVDTSGSMQGEVDWIGKLNNGLPEGMLVDLNAALEADGISNNQFALVSFINEPRFRARQTEPYTVTVFGPNGDIVSKRAYGSNDFGTVDVGVEMSQIHLADFTLPGDGQYTVVVDMAPVSSETSDPYGPLSDPAATTEYEFQLAPVVEATEQSQLLFNTKIKGQVSGLGNEDKYTFHVDEAGYYYFDSLTRRSDLHWSLERGNVKVVEAQKFQPAPTDADHSLVRLEPGDHELTVYADSLSKGTYEFRFLSLASAAASLVVGEKMSGVLRPAAETDVYRFTAAVGQHLSFLVEPAGTFDHSLVRWRLVDRWGNTVFDERLTQSQHDLVMRAGGDYYLLVDGDVSDPQVRAPYEIMVVNEGQEPAIDIQGLTTLVFTNASASIGPVSLNPGESASYGFHLDAEQLVYLDAITEAYDLTWTLEGPGGTLVDGVRLSQAVNSAVQMLAPGDYRLNVSSLATATVDYQFAVYLLPDAGGLLSEVPLYGSVASSQAIPFRFDGQAGNRLYVDIDGWPTGVFGQWALISPWGQVFKTGSMFGSSYEPGEVPESVVEIPASGTWSLVVERGSDGYGVEDIGLALHPIVNSTSPLPADWTVVSSIDVPTEIDTYTFTIATPTLVHFDSRTNSSDLLWSLLDGAGPLAWTPATTDDAAVPMRKFAQSDASGLQSGESSVFALPAGQYSIEVHGVGAATGAYEFRLLDLSTGDSLLPMAPSDPDVSGSLAAGNHSKVYRLQAFNDGTGFLVGDQLQFQLNAWSGSAAAQWRLVDQFGHELFNAPVSTSTVQAVLPYVGDYFLLMEGAVNDTSAPSYALRVEQTGNQAFASQAPIVQLNELNSGEIASSSQFDSYAFTLSGRTQLYVDELTSPEELPWQIKGPGGTIVAEGRFNAYMPDGYDPFGVSSRPVHTSRSVVLPAGTYEIQVGGFGYSSPTGEYELKIAAALTELALDQSHAGEFPAASHAEVLKFQGTAGERLVLTVDPWGTADEATAAADRLEAVDGPYQNEDGFLALSAALRSLDFRPQSTRQFILITDEPRSVQDANSSYSRLLSEIDALGGTLHTVLDAPMRIDDPSNPLRQDASDVNWYRDDWWFPVVFRVPEGNGFPHGLPLLGLDSSGDAYLAATGGGYDTLEDGDVHTAMDMIDRAFAQQTVDFYQFADYVGEPAFPLMVYSMDWWDDAWFGAIWNVYGELAHETGGGIWDLNELRAGGSVAQSFSNAFVDFIKRDVEQKLAIGVTASSPDALFQIVSAHYANGAMEYDLGFLGDGHAQSYDLQFVQGTTEFGRVPVVILADYNYDVDAVDEDEGDTLTYELVVGAAYGATIDGTTGRIAWDPQTHGINSGDYLFKVRVTDGHGGEATQSWSVTVADTNAGNHPPTVDPISPVVATAGRPIQIEVYAEDRDHDRLSYRLVDHRADGRPVPDGMSIDALSGVITWTPDEWDIREVPYEVEVRVIDGRGGVATTWLSVTVVEPDEDRNLRPEIVSAAPDPVPALGSFAYQVKAIDPNGDPLEYQVLLKPEGMIWDETNHSLYWQPLDAQVGTHRVVVEVSDGRGGVTLDSFPVTVTPTNEPPEIKSDPADAGPAVVNRQWCYRVVAEDPNGDELTYSIDPDARKLGASIDPDTGVLTWSFHEGDDQYIFAVEILVEDGRGGWDVQRVKIPVNPEPPPNQPPVFLTDPPKAATPNEQYRYLIQVADENSAELTLGLDGESRRLGISLEQSTLTSRAGEPGKFETVLYWTPVEEGTFEVLITAWDEHGAQTVQRYPLKVTQRHPPKFTTQPPTDGYYSVEWVYAVGVKDEDGDAVDLSLGAGAPAGMNFDVAHNRPYLLQWTPPAYDPANPLTSVTVTVVATDARGDQATQTFDVALDEKGPEQNLAPQVTSQPFGPAIVGQEWTYVVEAVDPEGDELSFTFINAPEKNLGMRIEQCPRHTGPGAGRSGSRHQRHGYRQRGACRGLSDAPVRGLQTGGGVRGGAPQRGACPEQLGQGPLHSGGRGRISFPGVGRGCERERRRDRRLAPGPVCHRR